MYTQVGVREIGNMGYMWVDEVTNNKERGFRSPIHESQDNLLSITTIELIKFKLWQMLLMCV